MPDRFIAAGTAFGPTSQLRQDVRTVDKLFSYLEFSATSDDFIITLRYSDPAHTEITFTPADLTNAQKDMKVKNVES